MRRLLMSGCAALVLQVLHGPATALTTPEPIRPEEMRGDDRLRQVWWRPGVVIKLSGSEGQSLMVEMPRGMNLYAFMLSEQNIIKPEEGDEIDPVTGKPLAPTTPAKQEDGCTSTINLKVCVRRDRFLFFIPFVQLSAQPVPMLMVEKKTVKGKKEEEIENTIVFELSTVPGNDRPYYGVKVLVGDPPAPPEPLPLPPPLPEPPPEPEPKPVVVAPMKPIARAVAPKPTPVPAPTSQAEVSPPPPLTVSRETLEAQGLHDRQAQADADVRGLLSGRQNRQPIVQIPPRAGMTQQEKEQLRQLEELANRPLPGMNTKYKIQGDPNLLGR